MKMASPTAASAAANGHDEKDEDEPVELMKLPGVGHEGQVHGVHHSARWT